MDYYKMEFGDVLRMSRPDFRIPPNTFKVVEFSPLKKKYLEKSNNPRTLREALKHSFLTATDKFIVKKWVLEEIGGLPDVMKGVKQKKTRFAVEFIRVEEEEKQTIKKEETPAEEAEEIIEERSEYLWQQL